MSKKLRFGLVGHNIGYSKSVDVFDAIFRIAGARGSFENFDIAPNQFSNSIMNVIKSDVDGFCVTIPYKKTIIAHLDDLHPVAAALQAVNSVTTSEKRTVGFNTDRDGFSFPLEQYRDRLKQRRAIVIGCGGSAKAATYALHTDFGLRDYIILGRNCNHLDAFATSLSEQLDGLKINTGLLSELSSNLADSSDIIINCTPLGGANQPDANPFPESFIWPRRLIYYDLNYNANNLLIEKAQEAGMICIDGSRMLTAQAIKSFDIWTGQTVPFEPVYKLVFNRE